MPNFSPTTFTFAGQINRRREVQSAKEQAEAQAQVDSIEKGRTDTEARIKEFQDIAVEAIQNGASPEQITSIRSAAQGLADSYTGRIAQLQAMAQQAGQDPSLFDQMLRFGEQQLQLFDQSVSAASLQTASAVGAREGKQKVSEAAEILSAAPQGAEAQRSAHVAPSCPLIPITNLSENALSEELGKLDAKRINDLETTAQIAIRTKGEVARMRAAIESGRFKTGVFADMRQFIARLFDFAGVDPAEVSDLIGDAATADTLDAASARLGVDMAQKLGRITNMSLKFVKDALPALTRTPEGNKILILVMERVADRDLEIAALADSYFSRFGSLRPSDRKSFFEATRDLDESDPVIDEKLRQRIIDGSKNAPASFSDIKGFTESILKARGVPEGIPAGSTKIGTTADGKDVWETPDGRRLVVE